jgi:hypothetical protein
LASFAELISKTRFEGRNRKLTLGTYPAIGLKAARELAPEALVEVARGDGRMAATGCLGDFYS